MPLVGKGLKPLAVKTSSQIYSKAVANAQELPEMDRDRHAIYMFYTANSRAAATRKYGVLQSGSGGKTTTRPIPALALETGTLIALLKNNRPWGSTYWHFCILVWILLQQECIRAERHYALLLLIISARLMNN